MEYIIFVLRCTESWWLWITFWPHIEQWNVDESWQAHRGKGKKLLQLRFFSVEQHDEKSTDFLWVSVKRRAERVRNGAGGSERERERKESDGRCNEWGKNVKIGQSSDWVIDTIVWYWIFGCMNVAFLSDPIKMEINSCSKVFECQAKARDADSAYTHTQCEERRQLRWNTSSQSYPCAKNVGLKILVSVYFLFICFTLKCDNTKDRVKRMFDVHTDGTVE